MYGYERDLQVGYEGMKINEIVIKRCIDLTGKQSQADDRKLEISIKS
jgi:hypothetical protein